MLIGSTWAMARQAVGAADATGAGVPSPAAECTFQVWGAEALGGIQAAFFMPESKLYAEEINSGKKPHPCWIWDATIQLGALCAAARMHPDTYLPMVKTYATALRSYETQYHDRPGLDVNPPPKNSDRYYDDNAWAALSLLDAYELTHDPQDLRLAQVAFDFTMSGEDDALGGGIYWHEDNTKSKNACSCGPGMVGALRFYQLTHHEKYLDMARALYEWESKHLQDSDGLVFDNVNVANGRIAKTKFTYNTAELLKANCMLFQITHEDRYRAEAQRIARAAEHYWARPSDGLFTGAGKLGVKLIEAFLLMHETDHDERWLRVVGRCLTALRQHRNANGWYAMNWEAPPPPPTASARLIDQAAAARAYWLAALHGVRPE